MITGKIDGTVKCIRASSVTNEEKKKIPHNIISKKKKIYVTFDIFMCMCVHYYVLGMIIATDCNTDSGLVHSDYFSLSIKNTFQLNFR